MQSQWQPIGGAGFPLFSSPEEEERISHWFGSHLVHLLHPVGVDGKPLVRIHNDTKQARVCVDQLGLKAPIRLSFELKKDGICLVTGLEVPKHSRLTEERQIGHVLAFFKLWRINGHNLVKKEGTLNKKLKHFLTWSDLKCLFSCPRRTVAFSPSSFWIFSYIDK